MNKHLFHLSLILCLSAIFGQAVSAQSLSKDREEYYQKHAKNHLEDFYATWLQACVDQDEPWLQAIQENYVASNEVFRPDFCESNEDGLYRFRNYLTKFTTTYSDYFEKEMKFKLSEFHFAPMTFSQGGTELIVNCTFQTCMLIEEKAVCTVRTQALLLFPDWMKVENYKIRQITPESTPIVTLPTKEKPTPDSKAEKTVKNEEATDDTEREIPIPTGPFQHIPAQAVDLGLSICWADHNVGATRPEEAGAYYAWGETEEKSYYNAYNYRHYNAVNKSFNQPKEISGTPYDVARAKWGGSWRMPTFAEAQELMTRCKWEREEREGMVGFRVTGPNGNSIFIPAAGVAIGNSLIMLSESAFYAYAEWGEKKNPGNFISNKWDEQTQKNVNNSMNWNYNFTVDGLWQGYSVRPVTSTTPQTRPNLASKRIETLAQIYLKNKENSRKQTFKLTGTVVDVDKQKKQNPLPGCSIVKKGTHYGCVSDIDGNFSLEVKPGDTLEFAFVGYKTVTYVVKAGTNNIRVVMKTD